MQIDNIIGVDLLFEATPQQLITRKGPEIEAAWKGIYDEKLKADDIMSYLSRLAPKGKVNTYIEWMTRLLLDWDETFDPVENGSEVRHALRAHSDNQDVGERDVMRYKTYDEFKNSFSTYTTKRQDDYKNKRSSKFFFKNHLGAKGSGAEAEVWIKGKLMKINSVRASRTLGSDTWCVANKRTGEDSNKNYIGRYTNGNTDPYFIISTKDFAGSEKIGFFPGYTSRGAFQDINNNSLTEQQITTLWENNLYVYAAVYEYMSADFQYWSHPDYGQGHINNIYDTMRAVKRIKERHTTLEAYLISSVDNDYYLQQYVEAMGHAPADLNPLLLSSGRGIHMYVKQNGYDDAARNAVHDIVRKEGYHHYESDEYSPASPDIQDLIGGTHGTHHEGIRSDLRNILLDPANNYPFGHNEYLADLTKHNPWFEESAFKFLQNVSTGKYKASDWGVEQHIQYIARYYGTVYGGADSWPTEIKDLILSHNQAIVDKYSATQARKRKAGKEKGKGAKLRTFFVTSPTGERWPDYEKLLKKASPASIRAYVDDTLGTGNKLGGKYRFDPKMLNLVATMPEGADNIIAHWLDAMNYKPYRGETLPDDAVKEQELIRKYLPNLEGILMSAGAKGVKALYNYFKGNDEKFASDEQDPASEFSYHKSFLRNRWPEAEAIFRKSPAIWQAYLLGLDSESKKQISTATLNNAMRKGRKDIFVKQLASGTSKRTAATDKLLFHDETKVPQRMWKYYKEVVHRGKNINRIKHKRMPQFEEKLLSNIKRLQPVVAGDTPDQYKHRNELASWYSVAIKYAQYVIGGEWPELAHLMKHSYGRRNTITGQQIAAARKYIKTLVRDESDGARSLVYFFRNYDIYDGFKEYLRKLPEVAAKHEEKKAKDAKKGVRRNHIPAKW